MTVTDEALDDAWIVSAVFFAVFGAICIVLTYLERPSAGANNPETQRKRRRNFTTLVSLSISLVGRAIWCLFRISTYYPPFPQQGNLVLNYFTRILECTLFGSCLLLCWQLAYVAGRALSWRSIERRRCAAILWILWITFTAFYLGTCKYTWGDKQWDKGELKRSYAQKVFDRYDDLIVSGDMHFQIVCILLVHNINAIFSLLALGYTKSVFRGFSGRISVVLLAYTTITRIVDPPGKRRATELNKRLCVFSRSNITRRCASGTVRKTQLLVLIAHSARIHFTCHQLDY